MNTVFKQLKVKTRKPIHAVDVSPDGTQFVIGQREITLWSTADLKMVAKITGETSESILTVRYSPDGKTLAYIDSSMQLRLVDLAKQKTLSPKIENSDLQWLSYGKANDQLMIAGALTQLFDTKNNKVLWTLPEQTVPVATESPSALAVFSSDGKKIAVGGAEKGRILVFDAVSKRLLYRLEECPDKIRWLSFDPRGRYLAAIEWYAEGVFCWDLRKRRRHLPELFNVDMKGCWCLQFHPGGKYLAVGMLSGVVRMIRLKDGEIMIRERPHSGRVNDVVFIPDGKRMLTVGDSGQAFIWNTDLDEA